MFNCITYLIYYVPYYSLIYRVIFRICIQKESCIYLKLLFSKLQNGMALFWNNKRRNGVKIERYDK
jgi:hypothetical protein